MKKSLIHLAVMASLAGAASVGRARTHDVAFTFRMGSGFPGEVNRTHPVSIYPSLMHATQPIRLYGDPGIYDGATNSVRGFQTTDQGTGTKISGVLVRPYPTQQSSGGMSATLGGAGTPAANQPADIIEDGAVMVKCNNFGVNPPSKDSAVFVWAAASAGNHVLGGFEALATAGSTFPVANARWNGPADASGIAELIVWKA